MPFNAEQRILSGEGVAEMAERDYVTVGEAARMLGVRKEKIARLVKQGVLTSKPSIVDARRRLIPRNQLEEILEEEGANQPASPREDGKGSPRPWPKTVGIVSDGSLQSTDIEEYMREHWRPS
jgi:excisionase family DNA binding protein